MNIEELKLVLETLRSLAGDASSAAIWWMALHYSFELLKVAAITGTILGSVFVIVRAFVVMNTDDDFFKTARDQLRIGCSGYLTTSERNEVRQTLLRMIAERDIKK